MNRTYTALLSQALEMMKDARERNEVTLDNMTLTFNEEERFYTLQDEQDDLNYTIIRTAEELVELL